MIVCPGVSHVFRELIDSPPVRPEQNREPLGVFTQTTIIPGMPPTERSLRRRPRTPAIERWISESSSERSVWLSLVSLLLLFYLPTASYGFEYHPDALTNVFTAWSVAHEQTFYLDDWEGVTGPPYFGGANQIIEGRGRPISKYPPGTALLAAPFHLVWSDALVQTAIFQTPTGPLPATFPLPSFVPGAIVAAATSAMGVASVSILMRRRLGHQAALITAVVLGLGTSYWSVAADALWQHGPVAMWLGFGLLALDSDRPWLSGAMFGLAVVTRPQVLVAVAVLGLLMAAARRSWTTVAGVGIGTAVGLFAYLGFNLASFGSPLPESAGGYWVTNTVSTSGAFFWEGLVRTFVDPERGILLWSPILVVALVAIRTGWKAADPLVKAAAVAGIVLLLLQLRGNVWTGGDAFFAYRYPLESLYLAAPLAAGTVWRWGHSKVWRARVAGGIATLSIVAHAVGSVIY
jgi:hypothetical protein